MLFIGPGDSEQTDAHEGYVAGCYQDGTSSDIWTDIRTDIAQGAKRTIVRYVAACECGWRGATERPLTAAGYLACQHEWLHAHFQMLGLVRSVVARLGRPLRLDVDFLLRVDPGPAA